MNKLKALLVVGENNSRKPRNSNQENDDKAEYALQMQIRTYCGSADTQTIGIVQILPPFT